MKIERKGERERERKNMYTERVKRENRFKGEKTFSICT